VSILSRNSKYSILATICLDISASITVKVMDGSTIVDTLEVTAANGWKFESKDLPKYRNGQEIAYTLTEDAVAQYETKIDKFTVTNSYTPETVKVSGQHLRYRHGKSEEGLSGHVHFLRRKLVVLHIYREGVSNLYTEIKV